MRLSVFSFCRWFADDEIYQRDAKSCGCLRVKVRSINVCNVSVIKCVREFAKGQDDTSVRVANEAESERRGVDTEYRMAYAVSYARVLAVTTLSFSLSCYLLRTCASLCQRTRFRKRNANGEPVDPCPSP